MTLPEPEPGHPLDDAELIRLYSEGSLALAIANGFGLPTHEESVAIEDRCLALHLAGKIDLLALVESSLDNLPNSDFFAFQHFFNRVLPQIDAELDRVLSAVEIMVSKGGQDLASNLPNGALVEWCRAEPSRARSIIGAAWEGSLRAGAHLTFALQALNDVDEARRFIVSTADRRRLSAMTALNRIVDPDPASRWRSLEVLDSVLEGQTDEEVAVHVLLATVGVARHGGGPDPLTLRILGRVLARPTDGLRNRAAHLLWAYPACVTDATLDLLLPVLVNIDPEHTDTIRELDLGLAALVQAGRHDRVISHVVALFGAGGTGLKLEAFGSTMRRIVQSPAGLSLAISSWLPVGDVRLCHGLSEALNRQERGEQPIALELSHLPAEPHRLAFLCRKITGWLFFQPKVASSALVSVLAHCNDEVAYQIKELLAHVLMRNYGSLQDFLGRLLVTEPAKGRLAKALASDMEYVEGLKAVGEIKELLPPDNHRRITHLRRADMMRAAHKRAEAQSTLLSLVRRSVLLYGTRSLSYVKDESGQSRPVEIKLGQYEVMVEVPRLETIDPIGLQITLRALRGEAPPV